MIAEITPNARLVLEHRYLLKDDNGNLTETPHDLFVRVARAVAEGDRIHEGPLEAARMEERYADAMSRLLFLPNSPTLMNAGTVIGQLAACFVIPVGDSIPEIFEAVRDVAVIHKSGGGTGMSFSKLRPKGDRVSETGGIASGPVSFMRAFDVATDVVKQGGRRRGANMAVLHVSHPDILEFVTVKSDPAALTNFNLSVAVPDDFMLAVERGSVWPLVNPRDGSVVRKIPARELWQAIAQGAWNTGDPGVVFLDPIERQNPTPALGRMDATNPCGEQPLLPYEACNLGSVNLARMTTPHGFDWEALDTMVRLGVRFLDNVIEVSRYPLPEIDRVVRGNRKIGLGVMGLAESVIIQRIPYASEEALAFASQVAGRVARVAREASTALARSRGSFPNISRSVWPERGVPMIRNATVTTVAPTGTLSIIAGTSSGVEPLFALAYVRRVLDGSELPEVNALFLAELERRGLPAARIIEQVSHSGSLQGIAEIPDDMRSLFATAYDVAPEWHVRMQAAVQEHTDNGVSKTVNLPHTATVDDVRHAYELAWRLGCKGVTVFRDGSRASQVLQAGGVPAFAVEDAKACANAEYAGDCRVCSV